MFLSSLRPWIFWVICWAGLEVNKAILVECLSCTIQHYLNQKWWCKGLRVARSALKTVHSGQFDNPPPPKKKYLYIYIIIYISCNTPLPYHSSTVSSWTYPLLLLSLPMPTYILQSMKTVDMISCHSKVQTSEPLHPLTPMSDQDWISPYYFKPTSSKQVMRVKKDINYGIISWSNTKFSKITPK